MDSITPGPLFTSTFTSALTDRFITALHRAYDTACELHDRSRGSNEVTFGFNLYHFAVHELCGEAATEPDGFRVHSRQPMFRMVAGDFELACHRVGLSEREAIEVSFPKNEGAACRMIEEQLWLPNVSKNVALADARKLVLAHMGNAEDGLRSVYLCVPAKSKDDRITEWAYTQCVWRADEAILTTAAESVLPPEERIDAPVIKLREKKKEADGDDE